MSFTPEYKLTINGFDVSATIKPFLLSIYFSDFFDTALTQSKIDITFHEKYRRSLPWKYKDRLVLELWYPGFEQFKFVSPTLYVDYIQNEKSIGETFTVSAMEADPDLGFTYGTNQLKYLNQKASTVIQDFAQTFNLNLDENIDTNIYLGSIGDILGTPDINKCEISFDSYAYLIRYIARTFGYFVNLRGKNLTFKSVEFSADKSNTFTILNMGDCYDLKYFQNYNNISKIYRAYYIARANNNVVAFTNLSPTISNDLNNKTKIIDASSGFYNLESASNAVYGSMYLDFISSFFIEISLIGFGDYLAGLNFYLDSSFGTYEGYYRCTQVDHKVDGDRGWISTIKGFPLKIVNMANAVFDTGYYGKDTNPPASSNLTISQNLRGGNTGNNAVTASQLDSYAKFLNNGYTLNIGNIFISEAIKTANNVRPDIAFCIALVESTNFTYFESINKFNPGMHYTLAFDPVVHNYGSWLVGVRAHIQHIFAYAVSSGNPADSIVDIRYSLVSRGSATTIDQLSGVWENDPQFTLKVKEKLKDLYRFLYPTRQIIIN